MRYFRQVLALIREEKLYSAMYIAGTALAIAFTMLIAEVYYVKVADIAPEVPINGRVEYYKYHPGKYLLAFHPKSSELNEHSSSCMSNAYGKVFFKQIAGTFARRIVCYSEPGKMENRGDQCGVIKFGSRIDLFVPLEADVKVKVGDKVRAVESVLAILPDQQ